MAGGGAYLVWKGSSPLERFAGAPGCFFCAGALLWFYYSTGYTFGPEFLRLQSGPFYKRIAYPDIHNVAPRRLAVGVSFALSWNTLCIDVGGARMGYMVSPQDRSGFLNTLAGHCPHLELRGGELVSRE